MLLSCLAGLVQKLDRLGTIHLVQTLEVGALHLVNFRVQVLLDLTIADQSSMDGRRCHAPHLIRRCHDKGSQIGGARGVGCASPSEAADSCCQ